MTQLMEHPSGYEVTNSSSPQELFAMLGSDAGTFATPSMPTFQDLIILSSQPLEEYLVIPTEAERAIPTTPSVDDPMVPLSQPSVQDPLTAPAFSSTPSTPGCFHLALHKIPISTLDQSDLPTWLLESERLDFVLSVGGEVWKKLIITWIRQERRLGFGLSEQVISGGVSIYCCMI